MHLKCVPFPQHVNQVHEPVYNEFKHREHDQSSGGFCMEKVVVAVLELADTVVPDVPSLLRMLLITFFTSTSE